MLIKNLILTGLLFTLVILPCYQDQDSLFENFFQEASTAMLSISDPHEYIVAIINEVSLDLERFSEFEIVEVSLNSDLQYQNITLNKSRTLRAFTACDGDCRIFFENLATQQIFEIQGLPLSYRPFSNLVWISDVILTFDRWSQPYYGIHYVVNIDIQELLLAVPFHD